MLQEELSHEIDCMKRGEVLEQKVESQNERKSQSSKLIKSNKKRYITLGHERTCATHQMKANVASTSYLNDTFLSLTLYI